jgi:hypothetical protein
MDGRTCINIENVGNDMAESMIPLNIVKKVNIMNKFALLIPAEVITGSKLQVVIGC